MLQKPAPSDATRSRQDPIDRPPPAVAPGPFVSVEAPNDAVVLFSGRNLLSWSTMAVEHGPAPWRVKHGFAEIASGSGSIATRDTFGDVQLHLDWSSPLPTAGAGQDRGHSGVLLMGAYEIQILDSFRNPTFPTGQAGAVFGQFPPLVNPIRPPGEWNSFDIVFLRPHFDARGKMSTPARMTVFFNAILVQFDRPLSGPTGTGEKLPYVSHADHLPIVLQEHAYRVRFRNIWARRLE